MSKDSKAKRKLVTYLRKKDSTLKEKDIAPLLSNINRFVNVVQKIYTEPQAQIKIKERKIKGIVIKQRVITTDYEEVLKVRDKSKRNEPIDKVIKRFNEEVTKKR